MVCMHMGFQDPIDGQLILANIGDDLISGVKVDTPGGIFEIKNGIDNGAMLGVRIDDNEGRCEGLFVKKWYYFRSHGASPQMDSKYYIFLICQLSSHKNIIKVECAQKKYT